MALTLSFSILAVLFSVPALFLSIYNFLQTRMIMKDLDLDRPDQQPHSLNSGRNIVDGMGMGRPATKDNIFDGEDDDNDNFDYNI